MEPKPFTLQQANEICNKFQHLVGEKLDQSPNFKIDAVVVAPYDETNIRIFIDNLGQSQDVNEALLNYPGPFYDVILLSYHFLDGDDSAFLNIRAYAKHAGLDCEFPTFPGSV